MVLLCACKHTDKHVCVHILFGGRRGDRGKAAHDVDLEQFCTNEGISDAQV